MVVAWITAADLSDPGDPNAPAAAEAASWALYMLSGQKYPGVSEVTEWYGFRNSSCFSCAYAEAYVTDTGHLFQPHGHRYFDSPAAGLRLRGRPIVSISAIETANGVLPSADYKVANRSVVHRTNGACWDFNTGVTVTYRYGQYPPTMGRNAAIKLGDEFLLALNDDDDCALPDNVISVTRLGISFTMANPADLAKIRMTGLYEVDLFLSIANPAGALKKPKVFSTNVPRGEKYL